MEVWDHGDRRYLPPFGPLWEKPCPDAFLYLRFTLGLEDVVNLRLGVRSWHRGPTLPSSGAHRSGWLFAFSDSRWARFGGWGELCLKVLRSERLRDYQSHLERKLGPS